MLSPLVRMEIPLKLLALVTGGRMLRTEPSESVLLQGRGSRDLSSLSVLLWRLLEVRLNPSRFPLVIISVHTGIVSFQNEPLLKFCILLILYMF